ncbi:MAG: sulfite exporter TauE/SafE family protein [Candidatus Nitrohelix vancouverensis]|uniref:Probable membrane transporter protein n=1 Tax=Candidatus Nitrohelix vancouverensis TaxID=2705534 RepID=A0A7T0G3V5_9BACT|nr:MAG: sulfite exporter TauE/SafE family protein [Candidatus Nitrohelix vancouverensis]
MIIVALGGALVGILSSGTGMGGGFLVVPLLIFLGKDVKLAVGTSFIFIFFAAASALAAHHRLGNLEWKTGLALAVGGLVGAQIGPALLEQVPDAMFKRVFAFILVGVGVWMLFSAKNNGA